MRAFERVTTKPELPWIIRCASRGTWPHDAVGVLYEIANLWKGDRVAVV